MNKQGREPMPTKEPLAEQFYSQVSESIKLIFDLTSRIDERVKMLVERQNDVEDRLDKLLEIQHQLIHRVAILETKKDEIQEFKNILEKMENKIRIIELQCEKLQLKDSHHDKRWANIFDFVFRMLFMLLGGLILYKMGWSSPPTP